MPARACHPYISGTVVILEKAGTGRPGSEVEEMKRVLIIEAFYRTRYSKNKYRVPIRSNRPHQKSN